MIPRALQLCILVASLVPLAFLIYRFAWRDEHGRRKPSLGFLVTLTAGVWLTVIFTLILDSVAKPRWALILRDIRLAHAEELKAIEVLPWPHEAPSLVADPVMITDKKAMREITRLLRTAKRYSPEHPSSNWMCFLALDYGDRKVYCEISSTRGNGVLIYVNSDKSLGWRLATFREVTLEHNSDDRAVAIGSLVDDAAPDFFLAGVLFARIGMTAVDHQHWRQPCF